MEPVPALVTLYVLEVRVLNLSADADFGPLGQGRLQLSSFEVDFREDEFELLVFDGFLVFLEGLDNELAGEDVEGNVVDEVALEDFVAGNVREVVFVGVVQI